MIDALIIHTKYLLFNRPYNLAILQAIIHALVPPMLPK